MRFGRIVFTFAQNRYKICINSINKRARHIGGNVKQIIGVILLFIIVLALGGVLLLNRNDASGEQSKQFLNESGMFQWDEDAVKDPDAAVSLASDLNITRWYQEFPEPLSNRTTSNFVKTLNNRDVAVYALIGSVEWGYQRNGKSLIREIKKISQYNQNAEDGEKICGIMADIEPYTSSKWSKNKRENMDRYVAGMIAAYEYARKKNIRFVICIARHYDDQGLAKQLERLIAEGCDEVAVMDYECGQEITKIATEAAFAKQYEKELHCILEFQEVGKHGLTENKTYRNKGISAAQETWSLMTAAYPDQEIICDYHWVHPILQMLEGEENN